MFDKKEKIKDWCPTQSGTYRAYKPQYLDDADRWCDIPVERTANGFPQPILRGGINQELGLYGLEQAEALRWGYLALHMANSGLSLQARVVPYEVVYDLKARALPEESRP